MSGRLERIMASTKPLITLLMDGALLRRVDDFRFTHRFSSRGAAIRFLIDAGLAIKTDPHPPAQPKRERSSPAS